MARTKEKVIIGVRRYTAQQHVMGYHPSNSLLGLSHLGWRQVETDEACCHVVKGDVAQVGDAWVRSIAIRLTVVA
jgi:hypothetical protein